MDNKTRLAETGLQDCDEGMAEARRAVEYMRLGKFQSASRKLRDAVICLKAADQRARLLVGLYRD